MKSLDSIEIKTSKQLIGNELFCSGSNETDLSILDFWRWHYSDVFDLQEKIAEYLVAKALGLNEAYNVGTWTLFDILYRNTRIEIKETSYYHSWQTDDEKKSDVRRFGINKAYSEYQDNTSEKKRQNDIYVFCLNKGNTRESSNPLQLENWEFYIVSTDTINKLCGDAKTISLSRLKKITTACKYSELKTIIDSLIEEKC